MSGPHSIDAQLSQVPLGPTVQMAATPTASDMLNSLAQQQAQIQKQIMGTLPAALSPQRVPGQPNANINPAFSLIPGQPNLPPPQGHADAKAQGIAKTVAGAGSIVGMFVKHEQQKNQRVLAQHIQKILASNDAIAQASQVGKDQPGYKDAQASIAKSKQIIEDTLSDPKVRKQVAKAFDINFVDPSQNKGPEHDAMKTAVKSYGDQLRAQTPDKLVPNQAAQAKLQMLQAQSAALEATMKAFSAPVAAEIKTTGELQKTQMQQEGDNTRIQYTQEQENARNTETVLGHIKTAGINYAARIGAAKIGRDATLGAASTKAKASLDGIEKRINAMKNINDPIKQQKLWDDSMKIAEEGTKSADKVLTDAIASRNEYQKANTSFGRFKGDPNKLEQYNKAIRDAEAGRAEWNGITSSMQNQMARGVINNGGSTNTGSSANPVQQLQQPAANSGGNDKTGDDSTSEDEDKELLGDDDDPDSYD